MSFNPLHLRETLEPIGNVDDVAAASADENASVIALLKGISSKLPDVTADADPNLPIYHNHDLRRSFGAPEDTLATDTTSAWSMVALLKGWLDRATP